MKIKLLKSYGLSDAGEIMDFNRGVAEQLILRGIAQEIRDEKRGGPEDTNKRFTKPPKGRK